MFDDKGVHEGLTRAFRAAFPAWTIVDSYEITSNAMEMYQTEYAELSGLPPDLELTVGKALQGRDLPGAQIGFFRENLLPLEDSNESAHGITQKAMLDEGLKCVVRFIESMGFEVAAAVAHIDETRTFSICRTLSATV